LIIGNSKSNHLGAQGTFQYIPAPSPFTLSKPGSGNVTEPGAEPTSSGCMTGDRTTDLKRSAVMSGTGIHRLVYRDICVAATAHNTHPRTPLLADPSGAQGRLEPLAAMHPHGLWLGLTHAPYTYIYICLYIYIERERGRGVCMLALSHPRAPLLADPSGAQGRLEPLAAMYLSKANF